MYLDELHARLTAIRAGRQALGTVDKTTPELIAAVVEIEDYVRGQIAEEERKRHAHDAR